MSINVYQDSVGIIEEADLTVKVITPPSPPKPQESWNRVAYAGFPLSSSVLLPENGQEFLLPTNIDDFNSYFIYPMNIKAVGRLKAFNNAPSIQALFNKAYLDCDTLIADPILSAIYLGYTPIIPAPPLKANNTSKEDYLGNFFASNPYFKSMLQKNNKDELIVGSWSVYLQTKKGLVELQQNRSKIDTKDGNEKSIKELETLDNKIETIQSFVKPFVYPIDKPPLNKVLILTSLSSSIEDQFLTFSKDRYCGVFIDTQYGCHSTLAALAMLYDKEVPEYTNNISFTGLTAVIDQMTADLCKDNNISYFFNFKNDNKLDWFGLGNEQAFKIFLDLQVRFRVKQALAKDIRTNAKTGYNDNRIESLRQQIYLAIDALTSFFENFQAMLPTFVNQSLSNKRDGKYTGVHVDYALNGELRRVEITISGGL